MDGVKFEGNHLIVETARERSGPQKEDKCFACGESGHWKSDCRNRRVRRDFNDHARRY